MVHEQPRRPPSKNLIEAGFEDQVGEEEVFRCDIGTRSGVSAKISRMSWISSWSSSP